MKILIHVLFITLIANDLQAQQLNNSEGNLKSLQKQISALTTAFANGDAALVASLHHPDIIKYFGGNNVVVGRVALEKGLREWFASTSVEFIENTVENTIFNGETAIQTCIFAIKTSPKDGSKPSIQRARSMVIYIRDKQSPTGWLSLREVAQEAPEKPE